MGYSYTKDAIAPVFQSDDTNIIETFSNMNNAQHMKASLFLQCYPFSNNILRLRLYSEVFHQINKLGDSQWNIQQMGLAAVLPDSEKIPYRTNNEKHTKYGINRIILQANQKSGHYRRHKIPIL